MYRKHKVCLLGASLALFILLVSTASLGVTTPLAELSYEGNDIEILRSQSTSVLAADPPPGMISYWKLDDGGGNRAIDSIGPNPGTVMDGWHWTAGVSGTALDLTPMAYVDCGGDPSLSFSTPGLLTIEAWVLLHDISGLRTIVQNGRDITNKMYHFAVYNGHLYFDQYDGSAHSSSIVTISDLILTPHEWHHVVVLLDTLSSPHITFYLDGNPQPLPYDDVYGGLTDSRFIIGYGQDPQRGHQPTFFGNTIDEVAVYNELLSDANIQLHHQNGRAGLGYLEGPTPPVATDDAYATDEDVPLSVAAPGVLANDVDDDGDSLSAVLDTGPSHGTLTLNADGSFDYYPDPDFNGIDTFMYKAFDGTLESNIATVTITVNAVNDAPVAIADAYTTDEDTLLTVEAPGIFANDSDVDGDSLLPSQVNDPAHGLLTFYPDGSFTYMPDSDWSGTDFFEYSVTDGTLVSSLVPVTITVNPSNTAPVANDDSYTTDEDVPLSVAAPGVLANDVDDDGDSLPAILDTGDSLSAVLDTGPSHGTLTLNVDGSFDYYPDPDFNGIDIFTYKAFDGEFESNIATVTITVNPVNDAPVAVDDFYTTDEDTELSTYGAGLAGVLENDYDVDGDLLEVVLVQDVTHGHLALDSEGNFVYMPGSDFFGIDTFTYYVYDGSESSNTVMVTIEVLPINDAPVANEDDYQMDEDGVLNIPAPGLLSNDYDVDGDPIYVDAWSDPVVGILLVNPDGSFEYIPDLNWNGFVEFEYWVYDGFLHSNIVTVTIVVHPVNDAPVGVDDDYTIDEDTSLDLAAPGLLANDYDIDGDAITLVVITVPSHGSGSIGADGSFSYTPHPDWYGVDSMTYQVFDGVDYSGIVTVTITVNSVNDAPVAVDDYAVTDEDTPIIIDFLGNDYDVDDTFTLQYVAWGTLEIHGVLDVIPNYEIEPGVFRYVLSYTPDPDWHGSSSSINYGIMDSFGVQSTAQVFITVNPVNDPPVAVDDYVVTDEDTAVIIDFMANDYDVDGDDFDWRVVGWNNIDLHGVAELVFNYEVEPGVFRTVLRYTPDLNWHGSTSTIYYVIGDSSNAQSSTAHIHITVNSVNDAPVAVDDYVITDEDTPIIIDFLGNDYDVDDAFALQYVAWGSGIHGQLDVIPNYEVEPGVFRYVARYTPDLDWYGTTSAISYGIRDTFGAQASAQIIITVNPVNDAPVAVDDNIVTNEDTPIIIDFLGNDYDVDDSFTFDYAVWGSGIHGELEFLPDYEVEPGVFRWVARYTPDPDWYGTTSAIVYGIRDTFGAQASAQIIINVNSVNDAPVAVDDSIVTNEDTPIIIDLLANDYDVDDTFVLQYVAWGSGIHGELEFLPDYEVEPGVFRYVIRYTPDPDWYGTTSAISYGIRDTFGAQASAQIIITVNSVNDAPVAVDDYVVIDEDTSVIIDFMANDYDVDDTFDWSYVQWNPVEINGELVLVHNYEATPGVFRTVLRYTPDPDWHGSSSSIRYGIRDSFGEQSTAQIFLTVTSVNDAPVAVDDYVVIDEDTGIIIDFMGNDYDVDDTFGWTYVAWSPIEINGELELVYDYEVEPGVFRDVIRYTPDPDWYGTTSAISYGIRDTFGAESNAQVFITVNSVNDAPVAVDDYVVTDEDTAVIIDFMGNDYDVDDTFDWAHVQWNPTEINGELELVHNYEASPGVFRTVLRYTPDVNWHGSSSSIQYSIRDTFDVQSSTATIYVTVNSVNDVPVAVDDYVVTDENTPVIIDFMANDYDIEGDSFDWAWMGYSGVDLHGEIDFQQIEVEPGVFRTVVVYTPDLNWYGTTSTLRYAIRDSLGADSLTAWIHITVNPVNDPPLANDDTYSTEAGVPIVVEAPGVLANDVDIDGDSLEALLIDIPMHGTVALNSDGSFTYTPDAAWCGVDTFTYYAFDGLEYSNIALVTITVVDVTPPVTTIQFTGLEGEYDWYYSDVEVILSATDDWSGVASTMYSLNGSTWMPYIDPFVLEDPGEHTIHYYSTDNAGNVEDIKTSTIKISKYTRSYVRGSGKIAEEDGGRGHFSFYVKFRMGGYLRGYAMYLFRVPGYRYFVWSTDWLGMAIDGNHALLEVKCSIKQYNCETRERVWLTDFILRIEIWDNGKGKSDVFQIRIFDESGELFHEAGFDPPGNLLCGNIRIVTRKWKCWCNDWW